MGRPSKFTQALADEICARLSKGEPLAVICREPHMVAVPTVSLWKKDHPEFAIDFARARDSGWDQIAADCLHIADETSRDTITSDSGDRVNGEWIARSRLRVETRLKLLAKWDPKRYGEKIEHEVSGDLDVKIIIGGHAPSDA